MEPSSSQFQPAGAGALLAGTTAAGVGVGALDRLGRRIGRASARSAGAIAGIPAGVFVVYRRYRGYFT